MGGALETLRFDRKLDTVHLAAGPSARLTAFAAFAALAALAALAAFAAFAPLRHCDTLTTKLRAQTNFIAAKSSSHFALP